MKLISFATKGHGHTIKAPFPGSSIVAIVSTIYIVPGRSFTDGTTLFNHLRCNTAGKKYGHCNEKDGQRRWERERSKKRLQNVM